MSRSFISGRTTAAVVGAGFCGTSLLLSASPSCLAPQPGSTNQHAPVENYLIRLSRGGVRAFSSAAKVPVIDQTFAEEVSKLPEAAQQVLRFWYPDLDSGDCQMQRFWFAGGTETDDAIRQQFNDLVEEALRGGTCLRSNFF